MTALMSLSIHLVLRASPSSRVVIGKGSVMCQAQYVNNFHYIFLNNLFVRTVLTVKVHILFFTVAFYLPNSCET